MIMLKSLGFWIPFVIFFVVSSLIPAIKTSDKGWMPILVFYLDFFGLVFSWGILLFLIHVALSAGLAALAFSVIDKLFR